MSSKMVLVLRDSPFVLYIEGGDNFTVNILEFYQFHFEKHKDDLGWAFPFMKDWFIQRGNFAQIFVDPQLAWYKRIRAKLLGLLPVLCWKIVGTKMFKNL